MKQSLYIWIGIVAVYFAKSALGMNKEGRRERSMDSENLKMKTAFGVEDEIIRFHENDSATDICLDGLTNYTSDLFSGKQYALKELFGTEMKWYEIKVTKNEPETKLELLNRKSDYEICVALDSDGKPKSGMMLGALTSSGQYSECVAIQEDGFKGRWCVLAYGDQLKMASAINIGRSVGLCFPASCTEETLNERIAQVSNATGIQLTIACPVQPTRWTPIDIVSLFVVVAIASACVLSTATEIVYTWKTEEEDVTLREQSESDRSVSIVYLNFESKWWQVATAFSVIKNTKVLFASYREDNLLNCLHGIRFISMTWVILGHVHTVPWSAAPVRILENFGTYANAFLSGPSQVIVSSRLSVSTFFLIGGILVTYHGLKRLDLNQPGKKIIAMYIKRYIRLTPPYALTILIIAGFYSKVGGGPLWPESISFQRQGCADYWWTHMLYINNIYPVKNSKCYPVGWYLATDFQLFLIAPLFILLLLKNKRLGISAMLVSIVATTIAALLLSIIYNSQPVAIRIALEAYDVDKVLKGGNVTGIDLGRVFPQETIGNDLNRKPWIQFPVYAIGMVVGYMLHETDGKLKITNVAYVIGWVVAIPSAAALVYGLHPYTAIGAEPPLADMAMYEALNKPVWAMAVSWVIVTCASGRARPINWLLASRYLAPLSKLTFGIYLTHIVIIQWFYYSLEVPIHFSTATFCFIYLAVVVSSIGGGYLMWIALEAPVYNILHTLYRSNNALSRPRPTSQNYDEMGQAKS